jgi:hypothetical protein
LLAGIYYLWRNGYRRQKFLNNVLKWGSEDTDKSKLWTKDVIAIFLATLFAYLAYYIQVTILAEYAIEKSLTPRTALPT